MLRIGLISDTHGMLRPEARSFLQGSSHIIHAGDVGDPGILAALAAIAPVSAVRGNVDTGSWAAGLPSTELLEFGKVFIYVIHDLAQIDIVPKAAGVRVVVYGHSHKPAVDERDGVLYVNPGAAGPRRFKLPVSIGELAVKGERVTPRIVELAIDLDHP
jgi:uncharacterized protein